MPLVLCLDAGSALLLETPDGRRYYLKESTSVKPGRPRTILAGGRPVGTVTRVDRHHWAVECPPTVRVGRLRGAWSVPCGDGGRAVSP